MGNENSITPLIQNYTVDFASTNNFLFVKGVQGDGHSTRYVDITLLNETQPYSVNKDSVEVVIRGTKPDHTSVFNTCEILDENTIRVEITQQMSAVAGQGDYEISIMDKNENRTLTSFPFFLTVSKSSFDIGYVVSSDEFGLLISKINQVNKLEADIVDIINETLSVISESRAQTDTCKEATENAISATDNLRAFQDIAEQAEQLRNANEEKRQHDTAAAILNAENATQSAVTQTDIMQALVSDVESAENERNNAENLRIQQAIDFANEEDKRKENELVRIENESIRTSSEVQRETNENARQQAESKRQTDSQNVINQTFAAISETNKATDKANAASAYAKSVGDDLVDRLNRGEFKGEKGDDGVVHTVSGQYAFQIMDDHLHMFYTEGDAPLDAKINEEGHLILTI